MSQKKELKKKIKNNLTPGGKVRRTLVQIRAEREGLKQLLDAQMTVLRSLVSGKVPRLAANGSHQQAVEYKELLPKAMECWPNSNGHIPELKKKVARVNGFINKLTAFE